MSSSIASANASGFISNRSLHSIFRSERVPNPSVMQALSIDE
jgi:hypothetical protein